MLYCSVLVRDLGRMLTPSSEADCSIHLVPTPKGIRQHGLLEIN